MPLAMLNHNQKQNFEAKVLKKLGLKTAPISTQILPPEPLAYFLFSSIMLSAALGQLARDCRHLMRTEIAEIREDFEEEQVDSSAMAQKRNLTNFEDIEGIWLKTKNEFGKVLDALISEHQGDLVMSPLARDFPIILINLQSQLNKLLREDKNHIPFLHRLSIDRQACRRNFELNSRVILAEPTYIALQMAGYQGDAHELVNRVLVPQALDNHRQLISVLLATAAKDPTLQEAVDNIPPEIMALLIKPNQYIGLAQQKALDTAARAQALLERFSTI
jgi:adenylosuccinate lyase